MKEILLYKTDNAEVKVEILLQNENLWLTQAKMAELFDVQKAAISKHLKNIFADGELDEKVVVSKMETTTPHGAMVGKEQTKFVNIYNLDAIIAVGYRINSKKATMFRIWATQVLKEYIIKGFTLDDERLKNLGGGNYWQELMARIRDIRASERYSTVRFSTFTQQASTTIRTPTLPSCFSRRCRTRCTSLYTDRLRQKSSTAELTQKRRSWGSQHFPATSQAFKMR